MDTGIASAGAANWSIEQINDDLYRAKFINVPDIVAEWVKDHGGLHGRDVLDFGCGEATVTLGIALRHKARRVVGVETHAEIGNDIPGAGNVDNCVAYAKAQLGLDLLSQNLELIRVDPDSSLDDLGTFDLVFSWSVFEHVSQDLMEGCLRKLKRVLRPHGVMFLQTTPLYYSAEGSHMKRWVPTPWAHLSMQQDLFYTAIRQGTEDADQANQLIAMYESLNRTTAPH
jgi:cyclopropane fatty-acyl-phospholipid synthase-like methyltransferase